MGWGGGVARAMDPWHRAHIYVDLKAQELANYLIGKRKDIDFCTPQYKLDRIDNKELREKISAISYVEWKELGYSKGSLHQLKEKAKSKKPFKVYRKLKEKLENV
jgi:CRISPR-associated protein Cas1